MSTPDDIGPIGAVPEGTRLSNWANPVRRLRTSVPYAQMSGYEKCHAIYFLGTDQGPRRPFPDCGRRRRRLLDP